MKFLINKKVVVFFLGLVVFLGTGCFKDIDVNFSGENSGSDFNLQTYAQYNGEIQNDIFESQALLLVLSGVSEGNYKIEATSGQLFLLKLVEDGSYSDINKICYHYKYRGAAGMATPENIKLTNLIDNNVNEISIGFLGDLNPLVGELSYQSNVIAGDIFFRDGTDVEGKRYVLRSPEDLIQLSEFGCSDVSSVNTHCSSHFILDSDIDMSGAVFKGIAGGSNSFKGSINGKLNEISNLYINDFLGTAPLNGTGFVSKSHNAQFFNLKLNIRNIRGRENVGGLIGFASSSTYTIIDNVHILGKEGLSNSGVHGEIAVGGLIGFGESEFNIIRTSVNNMIVSSFDDLDTGNAPAYAGGFFGEVSNGTLNINYSYIGLVKIFGTNNIAGVSGKFYSMSGLYAANFYSAAQIFDVSLFPTFSFSKGGVTSFYLGTGTGGTNSIWLKEGTNKVFKDSSSKGFITDTDLESMPGGSTPVDLFSQGMTDGDFKSVLSSVSFSGGDWINDSSLIVNKSIYPYPSLIFGP